MPWHRSLTAKTVAIALVHLAALASAAGLFAAVQLGRGFDSFLLGQAREHLLAVSREFAMDVRDRTREERDVIARSYDRRFGVRTTLVTNEGRVMAGSSDPLPAAVLAQLRPPVSGRRPPIPAEAPRGEVPHRGPREGNAPPDRGLPPMPSVPPALYRVEGTLPYWIAVRVPIMEAGRFRATPGTLLFASSTLIGNPFYLDPAPWIGLFAAALLISALCWIPFVRRLTRDVTRLTAATEQIATGRFDVDTRTTRLDELGRLSATVGRMARQLEGHIKGQKGFLAAVAHELRSPLARITMATALASRTTDPRTGLHLRDLQEDVELMRRLTDDLLLLARNESGLSSVAILPTDLTAVVADAVRQEAREASVHTAIPAGLQVLASRNHLERAVANLVRNALQHGAPGGPIRIHVVCERTEVLLSVTDEGPGVPEADLADIFMPFMRADASRSRQTGGVGLGLAIVRSAAEACGGTASCRNVTPTGLEVTLRLRVP